MQLARLKIILKSVVLGGIYGFISLIDGVWTILTSVSITLEAEEFKVET
jgi:hypothetical protein